MSAPLRATDVEPAHRLLELLEGAERVRLEAVVSEHHRRTTHIDAELLRRILRAALGDRL